MSGIRSLGAFAGGTAMGMANGVNMKTQLQQQDMFKAMQDAFKEINAAAGKRYALEQQQPNTVGNAGSAVDSGMDAATPTAPAQVTASTFGPTNSPPEFQRTLMQPTAYQPVTQAMGPRKLAPFSYSADPFGA